MVVKNILFLGKGVRVKNIFLLFVAIVMSFGQLMGAPEGITLSQIGEPDEAWPELHQAIVKEDFDEALVLFEENPELATAPVWKDIGAPLGNGNYPARWAIRDLGYSGPIGYNALDLAIIYGSDKDLKVELIRSEELINSMNIDIYSAYYDSGNFISYFGLQAISPLGRVITTGDVELMLLLLDLGAKTEMVKWSSMFKQFDPHHQHIQNWEKIDEKSWDARGLIEQLGNKEMLEVYDQYVSEIN